MVHDTFYELTTMLVAYLAFFCVCILYMPKYIYIVVLYLWFDFTIDENFHKFWRNFAEISRFEGHGSEAGGQNIGG